MNHIERNAHQHLPKTRFVQARPCVPGSRFLRAGAAGEALGVGVRASTRSWRAASLRQNYQQVRVPVVFAIKSLVGVTCVYRAFRYNILRCQVDGPQVVVYACFTGSRFTGETSKATLRSPQLLGSGDSTSCVSHGVDQRPEDEPRCLILRRFDGLGRSSHGPQSIRPYRPVEA